MNEMWGCYFGTVSEVYAPTHPRNISKYQYEYQVLVTADAYAQIPCRCIRMDPYGSYHNYEDAVLVQGYRVFVLFPKGDRSLGIIIGGSRLYGANQPDAEGYYYRHRYNEIEWGVNKKGEYLLVSDDGPAFTLAKTFIKLDDSAGDSIILDKTTKTLTINCTEWKVVVNGSANITVAANATLAVQGNCTATVGKDLSVKCKNAKVEAEHEASVKAGGDCSIEGKAIKLNKAMGKVLTTVSMPIACPITGMPSTGVDGVLA